MDPVYKKYINKYGNFSHNLNIEIDESISEDEKNTILYDIFNLINEKEITKNISNTDVSLKWRVYDNDNLFLYYTDGNGILSDKGVYWHTKLLLNDINKIKNRNKFTIRVSKPLTKSVCLM